MIESLLLMAGIHPNPGPTRTRKSKLLRALAGPSALRPGEGYTQDQARALLRALLLISDVLSKLRKRTDLILNHMLRTGFFEPLARRLNTPGWQFPHVELTPGGVVAQQPDDPDPGLDPAGDDPREDHLDLLSDQTFLHHLLEVATLNAAGHPVVPAGLTEKFRYLRSELDREALSIGVDGPGGACFAAGSCMALWGHDVNDWGDGIRLPETRARMSHLLKYAARQIIGQLKNVLHWKR